MYVLELAGQDDEFATYEARQRASDVTHVAPGLATARGITDAFADLAFTHRASELVGQGDPTVSDARAILDAATIEREGTVAVRAVDVRATTGVDTQRVERELGDVLVERGFAVDLDDPDHEVRALFSGGEDGTCLVSWLAAETTRGFTARKPTDRPFFQPGSMDPMLARALVNIAGARPSATVLDPMCGTGGILVEAGLVGADIVGIDVQREMVEGTRANLDDALDGDYEVLQGTAGALPLAGDSVDAVVFDLPYGRQSKIAGDLHQLVADTLGEVRRVAPRCVIVGDRPWTRTASEMGWTAEAAFTRRVHKSLTRYILVLRR
ncbi:methyltransferase domain-containing protein [Halovenus marina]|uniref:methyltransferase domain-containing protein n=1 Tax=Halovenus marina TaxID=3396621 RepID=UPI003F5537A3